MYAEDTFHPGSEAEKSGEYHVLTRKRTTTSASGELQLTFTAPAEVSVRVPYMYLPESPNNIGYLMFASDGTYLPCTSCGLCQLEVVTIRVD